MAALFVVSASLAALAVGCGSDEALVGGECAPGYVQCGPQQCCSTDDASIGGDANGIGADGATDATEQSDGTQGGDGATPDAASGDGSSGDGHAGHDEAGTGDGATSDGSATDAATDAGPVCTPPLVDCSGQCVDTTSDPFNCGSCGHLCASQICQSSSCIGAIGGGIVFIGHDYATTPAGTAQARVLSNAVFMPQDQPLRVLSYERYALASSVSHVKAILNGVAQQTGRTLGLASTTNDADIPNTLSIQSYAVLLVHDQPNAPAGALAALGASWQATLTTFTQQGGIVVVLDGGTGIGQMPAFSTTTSLLSVTAQSSIITGVPLDVVAPGDAVGIGVVSPYGAGTHSVSFTTEPNGGNVAYVVVLPSDAGSAAPVVVHKTL